MVWCFGCGLMFLHDAKKEKGRELEGIRYKTRSHERSSSDSLGFQNARTIEPWSFLPCASTRCPFILEWIGARSMD